MSLLQEPAHLAESKRATKAFFWELGCTGTICCDGQVVCTGLPALFNLITKSEKLSFFGLGSRPRMAVSGLIESHLHLGNQLHFILYLAGS
jgi:hypothetical protein